MVVKDLVLNFYLLVIVFLVGNLVLGGYEK